MADEQTPQTPPAAAPESTNQLEGASLEGEDSVNPAAASAGTPAPSQAPPPKKGGLKTFLSRFSIYLLLFMLVLVVAVMVVVISYLRSHSKQNGAVTNQTLSQSSLSKLAQSDVTVGDVKQTLNVQSNAVFAGQVLVRQDLQVAGKIQVGGALSLTSVSVSGDTLVNQLQVNKNLAVSGDSALQGQLTVQKSLSVNGGGSFNGPLTAPQITVNTLQLNGDLTFTHHISAGGSTPSRSNGSALGSGGTASVSGSDTAGSVSINTGGSPSTGCFVTITFTSKFNATPHVVVTPIGASAAGLSYYVNRSTSNFSICTTTAAPAGASFGFDYIAFD